MKKTIITGLFAAVGFSSQGQTLAIPAPRNAHIMIEANLPVLFSKMSASAMDHSPTASSLFKTLVLHDMNDDSLKPIASSGLDFLARKAYIHYVDLDSVNYAYSLLPIKSEGQFSNYLGITKATEKEIFEDGILYTLKQNVLVYYPKAAQYAVMVKPDASSFFFDDEDAERYGLQPVRYNDYSADAVDAVEAVDAAAETSVEAASDAVRAAAEAATAATTATEAAEAAVNAALDSSRIYTVTTEDEKGNKTELTVLLDEEAPEEAYVDDYADADQNDDEAYQRAQQLFNAQVDSIARSWAKQQLAILLKENLSSEAQITQLKGLPTASRNNGFRIFAKTDRLPATGALAYFGLRNSKPMEKSNSENWSVAAVDFNDKAMNIDATLHYDEDMAKRIKRINSRKPNKKFAKYLRANSDIGWTSFSMNTKNYLEETPGMIQDFFGPYFKNPSLAYLSDLFALLLDEKAVGKAISGDGMFVFTDMAPKTYKTVKYNYDEDYNSTVDTIMKTESWPNGFFMFSTKDAPFMEKTLNFFVNKKYMDIKNGLYHYASQSLYDPFEFFFTIKDGIVFAATRENDLQQIKAGTYRNHTTAEEKKMLRRNLGGWLKISRLTDKLTFEDDLKRHQVNQLLSKTGTMRYFSEKVKNNSAVYRYKLESIDGMDNSLQYLMYLLDTLKGTW